MEGKTIITDVDFNIIFEQKGKLIANELIFKVTNMETTYTDMLSNSKYIQQETIYPKQPIIAKRIHNPYNLNSDVSLYMLPVKKKEFTIYKVIDRNSIYHDMEVRITKDGIILIDNKEEPIQSLFIK